MKYNVCLNHEQNCKSQDNYANVLICKLCIYLQDHHAAQISTPVMQQKPISVSYYMFYWAFEKPTCLRFEGFICETGCTINTEPIIELQITNPILVFQREARGKGKPQ